SALVAEPSSAALDFARHAAVAIENARLVAETRGRIRTLEAVAAFTDLTPTEPDRARSEMAHLVSRALAGSQGELWLLEDGQLELVDALDRERRMMNAILRHSPVGVMLEDAGGRIVYANPEIEAIYSLQASEMPGRKPDEVFAAAGATPADEADAEGTMELRM